MIERRLIFEVQPDGDVWVWERVGKMRAAFITRASSWDVVRSHFASVLGGEELRHATIHIRAAKRARVHWSD